MHLQALKREIEDVDDHNTWRNSQNENDEGERPRQVKREGPQRGEKKVPGGQHR
jgi:hypothetical protein